MNLRLLALPGAERLTAALAHAIEAPVAALDFRRFPDGESYLRIDGDVRGHDVVIAAALRDPDPQLMTLWSLSDTLREMGARRIALAAPYLPYMRQDARFREGEAITSRTFGRLASQAFDWVVTVDPHLHRYQSLDEVYRIPTQVVRSAPAIASWVRANVPEPMLIGPDAESEQWVADVARRLGCPWQVLLKTRRGDRDVSVTLPDASAARGRTPVILDDIVSSGHTMAEAARHVSEAFGVAPVCIGVHAMFAPGARELLASTGAARMVTCNAIEDETNAIDVLPEVARVIAQWSRAQAGV
ncbi:ribose-phosphate diphosphokinase [Ramlibacter humi]|uniref:Ribose-phosphate diphosphokinase n=1 Tax=Ramlibacter humi TaxID=2530451 RepID=A0A4Z0BNZ1_9BURK|nr:ribose-phosphate diphosphokinase [Ramlibacter humi]TFZ00140.1 ribose-phosphate diphosphokinase [Ramlibacter humi]